MLEKIKIFFKDINEFFKSLVTLKFEGYDYDTLENGLIKVKDEFGSVFDGLMASNLTKEEFKELFEKYKTLGDSLDRLDANKISSDYLYKFGAEIIFKSMLNMIITVFLIILNFPLGLFATYLNYLFVTVNGDTYNKEDTKMTNYFNHTIDTVTKINVINGNIYRLFTKKNEEFASLEEDITYEEDLIKEREKCLIRQKEKY